MKPPNPKYVPKPYEQMLYPGQRIQIDVKFVPSACLTGDAKGKRFYQYTAIDEFSRWRYVEAFERAQHLLFHDISGASHSGFPDAY